MEDKVYISNSKTNKQINKKTNECLLLLFFLFGKKVVIGFLSEAVDKKKKSKLKEVEAKDLPSSNFKLKRGLAK